MNENKNGYRLGRHFLTVWILFGSFWGDSGGHFKESIFTTELMTPYSNEGQVQPATDLTLSALSSLGWGIDLSKAQERN